MSIINFKIDDNRKRILNEKASSKGKTINYIITRLLDDFIGKNIKRISANS